MLHSVTTIRSVAATQQFYSDLFGMSRLRFREFPDGSANAFSGILPEARGFALELVQPAALPALRHGSGFRHISLAVPNLEAALQRSMDAGAQIIEGAGWEAGEVFVQDPSGYLWELVPWRSDVVEPFRSISLLVQNLEASTAFYTGTLGMRVFERESCNDFKRVCSTPVACHGRHLLHPVVCKVRTQLKGGGGRGKYEVQGQREPRVLLQVAVCWGAPESNTALDLTQLVGRGPMAIDRGTESYVQVACATDDVYKTEADVAAHGGRILRAAGPVPGIGTRVVKVADPDGWVLAFVDAQDFMLELCKAGTAPEGACSDSSSSSSS